MHLEGEYFPWLLKGSCQLRYPQKRLACSGLMLALKKQKPTTLAYRKYVGFWKGTRLAPPRWISKRPFDCPKKHSEPRVCHAVSSEMLPRKSPPSEGGAQRRGRSLVSTFRGPPTAKCGKSHTLDLPVPTIS